MKRYEVGDTSNGDEILEILELSDGQFLLRTEGRQSDEDQRIKLQNENHPIGVLIKHAHFALDYFGKMHYDPEVGKKLLDSLVEIWHGGRPQKALDEMESEYAERTIPGYNLDYFFYGMAWILEVEDIGFEPGDRPDSKQEEIDRILSEQDVEAPPDRPGSELAISLFCDIANGTHPVEAFYRVNLRI